MGLLGPLLPQERVKTSNMFPCSLPERGWAGSLYGVRIGVCPGVRPEGCLRCFAHPFDGVEVQGVCAAPCFCSWHRVFRSRLFRSGSWVFWSFCILLSIICPNCTCTQLFLVPYSFFVFCCSRRGVSSCKYCSTATKGPRSQPVSGRAGDKTIFLHSIRKPLCDSLSRPPDALYCTTDSIFWCNSNAKWVWVCVNGVGVGWEKMKGGF